MYNQKNLVVVTGGSETGDGIIDITTRGAVQGWELVIYNGSGSTITVDVHNISLSVPDNSVLDEAFRPFTSFTVAGTTGGDWSWYIRG